MDESEMRDLYMDRKKIATIGRLSSRVFLSVLAALVLVFAVACGKSESGTSVSISMADRNVKQGDEFTVDVRVKTDALCRGAQFDLSFDPALMKCDSVSEGSFLSDWAAANGAITVMIPQSPSIDNSQGRVPTIGIAIMGGSAGGATGSGVVCTYHFTALADGKAEPTLSDVVLSDESGQAIPDVEVNN
jgi:hypothetical protein